MKRVPMMTCAAALLFGCSGLSVKKVDPAAHVGGPVGERVALPIPAFRVTPNPGGSLDVEKTQLPDPTNTFAVDGWSVIASHSLEIKTDNGVLTEIKWAPDATAVLTQAAKAAGGVAAEGEKTQAAHDKAVRDAQLEVEQARIALAAAKELGDKAKIVEATAALRKALAKLASVKRAPVGPFNEPLVSSAPESQWIPGPIVFVIEEEGDKVRLVPAAAQQRARRDLGCDVSQLATVAVTRPGSGDLSGFVVVPCAVKEIVDLRLRRGLEVKTDQVNFVRPRATDPGVIEIGLKKTLEPGRYILNGTLKDNAGRTRTLAITLDVA